MAIELSVKVLSVVNGHVRLLEWTSTTLQISQQLSPTFTHEQTLY